MAKKTQAPATTGKTTTITLTLPDDAKLLRTGTMVATRGNLGSMSRRLFRKMCKRVRSGSGLERK